MLVDQLTINDAGGASATLRAQLVVVMLAAVIVLPALGYLLRLIHTSTGGESSVQIAEPRVQIESAGT
jgi:cytochrome d ubiquinol oxidase subunit II